MKWVGGYRSKTMSVEMNFSQKHRWWHRGSFDPFRCSSMSSLKLLRQMSDESLLGIIFVFKKFLFEKILYYTCSRTSGVSQTALELRYVFCDRTVPVGKVFSSSSRCDEASFAVRSSARIENESAAMYCC